MNNIESLENIFQNKKWAKNDIGMGRIQCSKLVKINGEMILIIASAISKLPIKAKVKDMLIVNGELTIFYDGEFCSEIDINAYNIYSEYLSEDEWSLLFEEESDSKLELMNLISNEERFHIDIHENIYNYPMYKNEKRNPMLSFV